MKRFLTLQCMLFSLSFGFGQQLISEYTESMDPDSVTWNPWILKTYAYYPDGKVAETINHFNSNDGFYKDHKSSFEYDADGNLLTQTIYGYGANSQTYLSERIEYMHNSFNQLLVSTRISNINGTWKNADRQIYTYTSGFKTMIIEDEWDAANIAWVHEFKHEFTNDQEGNIVEQHSFLYNSQTGSWLPSSRYIHTYYNSGQLENSLLESFYNQTWSPHTNSHYSYNSIDSLAEEIYQYPALQDNSKYIHTYNPDHTKHRIVTQRRVNGPEYWGNFSRVTYNYGTAYLGTTEKELSFSMEVYPNPATDMVSLRFGEIVQASLKLTDLQGKLITSSKISGSAHELNLAEIPSGIYLLNVSSDEISEVRRIVKK